MIEYQLVKITETAVCRNLKEQDCASNVGTSPIYQHCRSLRQILMVSLVDRVSTVRIFIDIFLLKYSIC